MDPRMFPFTENYANNNRAQIMTIHNKLLLIMQQQQQHRHQKRELSPQLILVLADLMNVNCGRSVGQTANR